MLLALYNIIKKLDCTRTSYACKHLPPSVYYYNKDDIITDVMTAVESLNLKSVGNCDVQSM